jgi:hypothetical protein
VRDICDLDLHCSKRGSKKQLDLDIFCSRASNTDEWIGQGVEMKEENQG